MSVRDISMTIKEARKNAGLTLEEMSEGICDVSSLYRIEHRKQVAKPQTFQKLMARTGRFCSILPTFENETDYLVHIALIHARFYLEAGQFDKAYTELRIVEGNRWNHNKYYYQKWLLFYSILEVRSGKKNYNNLKKQLLTALYISIPDIRLENFENYYLSIDEIEILILLAHVLNDVHDPLGMIVCSQINDHIDKSSLSTLEKSKLHAECAIVYVKILMNQGDYSSAREVADIYRHRMLEYRCEGLMLELSLLVAVCDDAMGNEEKANKLFEEVLYSVHLVKNYNIFIYKKYFEEYIMTNLPVPLKEMFDFSLGYYPDHKIKKLADFSNGVFDVEGADTLTFGKLVYKLRNEADIPQKVLCRGICSVSKLSKIENDTLMPDILLAEALLQRLGLSENEFEFFGMTDAVKCSELEEKLENIKELTSGEYKIVFDELKQQIPENFVLYKQIPVLEDALKSEDHAASIDGLKNALTLSLENFEITNLVDFRLSRLEIVILNYIAREYLLDDNLIEGARYVYELIAYHERVGTDIILQSQILPETLKLLCYQLYQYNSPDIGVKFFKEYDNSHILSYSMRDYAVVCYYWYRSMQKQGLAEDSLLRGCLFAVNGLYEKNRFLMSADKVDEL